MAEEAKIANLKEGKVSGKTSISTGVEVPEISISELGSIHKTDWIKIKPAEIEKIIIDLYKEGASTAKIGLVLRDKYGIPKAKLLGKKITAVLKNAKISLRSEENKIKSRIEYLKKHIEKNKHDQPAKKRLVKEIWALKKAREA